MHDEFDISTAPVAPGSHVLIEANAGTGKTHNIERLWLRLLLERGLEPSEILVVTFTEAATAELRARIRKLLADESRNCENPEILRRALASFDEAAIFTIHGFCRRVLARLAFESGAPFDTEMLTDTSALIRETVADFFRAEAAAGRIPSDINLKKLTDFANILTSKPDIEILPAAAPAKEAAFVGAHLNLRAFLDDPAHGFEARKLQRRLRTFDDILQLVRDALRAGGGADSHLAVSLRSQYKVALIDEFQDTDPVQYEIFNTVFKRPDCVFYAIGDPKQAIYGFRNGDIHAYLAAARNVTSRFTLSRNFRSDARLIRSVNALFNAPGTFIENNIGYKDSESGRKPEEMARILLRNGEPDPQPFTAVRVTPEDTAKFKGANEAALARECAGRIARMLRPGEGWEMAERGAATPRPLRPSDFAILVSTGRESGIMQAALKKFGVPSVRYKSGNIFKTEDAKDTFHILAAMVSPSRAEKIKTAFITPFFGMALDGADAEFTKHQNRFTELRRTWLAKGVAAAIAEFAARDVMTRLASLPDAERKLTNFRHLAELLHQAERDESLNPAELLAWLRERIVSDESAPDVYLQRMESDDESARILTMHSAKGLQFPIVFCPFLCIKKSVIIANRSPYWTTHTQGPDGVIGSDLALPLTDNEKDRLKPFKEDHEILSEDVRLAYVSLTRAENHCVVYFGDFIDGWNKPFKTALAHIAKCGGDFGNPAAFQHDLDAEALRYRAPSPPALSPPPPTTGRAPDQTVMSYTSLVLHNTTATTFNKTDDAIGDDDCSGGAVRRLLPPGINTGNCVHEIFERLDYTAETPDPSIISNAAQRYGLNDPEHRDALARLIRDTLNTPLPSSGADTFTLSALPKSDTLREWEFFVPVRDGLNLAPFARMGLSFAPGTIRKGYMTGSIDLFFRRKENGVTRWYFADWKTDTLSDYSSSSLSAAMLAKNYTFQAIVYSAALHRHLQRSWQGYDFATHFGGGYYVFVRGAAIHRFTPSQDEVEHWAKTLFH
ncbi:MAG: UvrD-helicase domain-containing protein [Kiritimatiellaeota bacterium]|nr:UvrD-helicase domain-containing protein [Kiritimatiellota bacterium]